jgi:hypothetical protein
VQQVKQAEPAAASPPGEPELPTEEKADQATGEIEVTRPPEEETGTWPSGWGWPYGENPQAYGWPTPYGGMQPYGGVSGGSPPWYPPYPMFGCPYPYLGMYFWPYMMPYFMPPYAMFSPPYSPPAQIPYAPHPAQPQPYVGVVHKKKTRPLYVVLLILGLLIVVGGAVAAFLLLTGNTSATYRLGDGSVTGADIDFRDMVVKQNGGMLTLTGSYDNNTKNEGEVIVTIQAISKGGEQLISFNVPVAPGTGKSFSQQKSAGSIKLSGATLSSLEYEGSTETTPSGESYPWSSTPQQSTPTYNGTEPTYPSTVPENSQTYRELNPSGSSPIPQDFFQTTPEISLPLPIY